MTNNRSWIVTAAVVLAACEGDKESSATGMAAVASGSLAVRQPSAQPAPSPAPEPEDVVRRPGPDEELVVTDAIRSRIESRHPEAAGFLTDEQIQEKLFALDLKRGKDDVALRHLDRLAKDKWILLSGPVAAPKPKGFEMPIRYTPRDPDDPMGLTSQWLSIELGDLEGYEASEYRPGERTAALVKYNGDKKASPGFDLILLGRWYE